MRQTTHHQQQSVMRLQAVVTDAGLPYRIRYGAHASPVVGQSRLGFLVEIWRPRADDPDSVDSHVVFGPARYEVVAAFLHGVLHSAQGPSPPPRVTEADAAHTLLQSLMQDQERQLPPAAQMQHELDRLAEVGAAMEITWRPVTALAIASVLRRTRALVTMDRQTHALIEAVLGTLSQFFSDSPICRALVDARPEERDSDGTGVPHIDAALAALLASYEAQLIAAVIEYPDGSVGVQTPRGISTEVFQALVNAADAIFNQLPNLPQSPPA